MQKKFRKAAKISLVLVFLVIIAGAVVRMTGSGMGCPDWPKCFGYYIPPTQASELKWKPNQLFEKGQVVIVKKTLQVANKNFKTNSVFNKNNWETYTKHNYAIFNAWHTWIEYANRLLGALAGLATLILAIISFSYWKKRKSITILSCIVVFSMVFQGWLGATVVYSVLEPVKITIHMVMALAIVALLIYIIFTTRDNPINIKYDKITSALVVLALGLTLIQIILGTQVRQFIDHQIDLVGENAKHLWLQNPTLQFYIHRSFSILILILNVLIAYRISKLNLGYSKIGWVLVLITLEGISGIIMYYADFPFSSQPLHLVLASLLFSVQFYLVLETLKVNNSLKTS